MGRDGSRPKTVAGRLLGRYHPPMRRGSAGAGPMLRGSAPKRGSAALAASLSFVVPGLGQVYGGARLRGLLMAVPMVLIAGTVLGAWLADRSLFVRAAFAPPVLLAGVALVLVLLVYRLWVIVDAYAIAGGRGRDRGGRAVRLISAVMLTLLLMASVAAHGWVAYVGWSAHQTLTTVFSPIGPQAGFGVAPASATPAPTPSPTPLDAPSAEPTEQPTPDPTPVPTPVSTPVPEWAADGRLNVLLIGSDAGPDRFSLRADAIILVSVDIASGRVAAFSLPRYTTLVPLPEPAASAFACRCLEEPINALYVFANKNPTLFPGDANRGFVALSGAAETLFGVRLDGMAVADLKGFVDLVDALGGLTVSVPSPVHDDEYPNPDGSGVVEVDFVPGEQHMDGWHALAYARTRHQDGDVARMQRQQVVMQALQRELGCDLLLNLPAVLTAARETLWTNLPLESVPDMLGIHPGSVESHVLFTIHNPALTGADVARIQGEVVNAFAGPAPTGDGGDDGGC